MRKIVLLLALVAYYLACGTCLELTEHFKRQISCPTSIPSECQPILNLTINGVAFADPVWFMNYYCNCVYPLNDYFQNCDPPSFNATKLKWYCSANSAWNWCREPAIAAADSIFYACDGAVNGTTCSSECKMAISTAYESLGCCLFTFYTIVFEQPAFDPILTFCNEDPTTFCVSGTSGRILDLGAQRVELDPECNEFVSDVDESCRHSLTGDLAVNGYIRLDELCGETCGPQIYQFFLKCDERTGGRNVAAADILCAVNSNGDRCGEFIPTFSWRFLGGCYSLDTFTCPESCTISLQIAKNSGLGCCLQSLLQIFFGHDYAILIPFLCGTPFTGNCILYFSDNVTNQRPKDDLCDVLERNIAVECTDYASADYLYDQALSDPVHFKQSICASSCSWPVYEYYSQCNVKNGRENASYFDFLCSKTNIGTPCAGIYSDPQVFYALDHACSRNTHKYCPPECSTALLLPLETWRCCLFTLEAFNHNFNYV